MILFPAVDIKDRQCVRLRQGEKDQVTVFGADPVRMAGHWASKGARWLHIVDLDGAFSGEPRNRDLISKICSQVNIPVQLGGGIRDMDTAFAYLEAGVQRLIIGTMALEKKNDFAALCSRFPARIGVSLDARDGFLQTKGWGDNSGQCVEDVLPGLEEAGSAFFVYTDINRDGMHSGINVQALSRLLDMTAKPVIAAGGVSTLEDIKQVLPLAGKGLEGVITGKAIYDKTLDFSVALAWLESAGE
ncbi:MAG: 1-(5-phosphoribosyl)-5-[(5-phosphoribosylamino)methylideneamino]imidazole-4-carboxamide isomerase [Desulfonatronovibrionaceae bacterium]